MVRYTASDIDAVDICFDDDAHIPTDGSDPVDEEYSEDDPSAQIEIIHDNQTVDQIDIGPEGAAVLHNMVQHDEYDIKIVPTKNNQEVVQ